MYNIRRPMTLDLDNGLPAIHIRLGTSYKNEATFCTHVGYCEGMNVGNLRLHQRIITNNTDIVESYIQFYDENHFDPIRLNLALDEEKNNVKGKITSMVKYARHSRATLTWM